MLYLVISKIFTLDLFIIAWTIVLLQVVQIRVQMFLNNLIEFLNMINNQISF